MAIMLSVAAIAVVAGKMIETPYVLGAMFPGRGFDCFSYLYYFYNELGATLPMRRGAVTVKNYALHYQKNPARAKRTLAWFLNSFGEQVESPAFMQPADLCLIQDMVEAGRPQEARRPQEMHETYNMPVSAIYVGAGNLMTCDVRAGIVIIPKHKIATKILEVRRPCLRQPH